MKKYNTVHVNSGAGYGNVDVEDCKEQLGLVRQFGTTYLFREIECHMKNKRQEKIKILVAYTFEEMDLVYRVNVGQTH